MKTLRHNFARFLSHYGMVFVLLVICVYYSLATYREEHPTGAVAGNMLAEMVVAAIPKAGSVLIVTRTTDADAEFAASLRTQLEAKQVTVVATVQGEPRDLRAALEKLIAEGEHIHVIATTPECNEWSLLQNVESRFASLGDPKILVPGSYKWPAFLTRQNLLNVANQITVVAILAVGMTIVIITAGIDLSVGSLIALSAVLVTGLIQSHGGGVAASPFAMFLCSIAGILVCALVGLFSGVMTAIFKVPPFIATLALMQVASGLAFILAKGESIYNVPESFTWLGRGIGPMGIPNAVLLMLILYAATHVLMSRTVLGRRIYSVGGNPEAARLSGVNVSLILIFAYCFCGAMAGLAGVVQASQLKSGAPTYGFMYELYAIAAVVVGGTSLAGGEGRILGTLIGAFIIAVIQNGMNLTGVQSYQQKVVLGVVILGAVLLDLLKKRDWAAIFRRVTNPKMFSSP